MSKPRLYIENLDGNYLDRIREGLDWIGAGDRIKRDTRVFIKPNLTFPVFRKGVMTNPECVEALIIALKDYTDHVTIGESDSGGYNRFDIADVQQKIGLTDIAKRHGAKLVNLSRFDRKPLEVKSRGRTLAVPFPVLLTEETDLVISAAVPKIHMNTLVSMTVKNLWGCIPEPTDRLKLHPYLPDVLHTIVNSLPDTIGVIDGQFGLNRSGPMAGDAVDLNWLMVCEDLYTADASCCELMQLDPKRVAMFRRANAQGFDSCEGSQPKEPFVKEAFYLKRAWTDIPGLMAFRSPFLSYVAYFSPLADFLHKVLYWFRKPFYDYDNPGETED